MATNREGPIYASTLLWGLVLLATAAVIVTRDLWSGVVVFASAAAGVAVVTGLLAVVERFDSEPQYDNKLDPWDE
ncbi:hypothetical protein [Halomicrobium katesii]|uniref:hypothetical protein n=1 Tax=Halomicrobium katesii TaxID=437163 RepID=UPI000378D043|nr:hypothetical protein [Halomicrobium katesii]